MKPLFLSVAFILIAYAIHAQQWSEVNPPDNLFNNTIFTTVAAKTGQVYAAGKFTDSSADNVVAVLNNGVWTELGTGSNRLHAKNTIYTLALDSPGNLYAGGAFTDATGNYYVAKWNGSQWSELGTGTSALNPPGQLFSLATDKSGNVYAGGEFIDAAGEYYIAKWDGHVWIELGTGVHALHANGLIYSILPDTAGNVYVAGHFTNAGGKYYVAKWNGADWIETGAGAGALNANSYINALAIDAQGILYAAGDFTDGSGRQQVAQWDGSHWTPLGAGSSSLSANGTINSIVIDGGGRLDAAGMFSDSLGRYYAAQWNGISWSELPATTGVWPVNTTIHSLSSDQSGALYAAGDFQDLNGDRYVAKLSSGSWSEPGLGGSKFPTQANPMHAVTVDTAGQVFVVLGDKDQAGIPIVERWDGSTWYPVVTSNATGYDDLTGLAADSSGNVYACGSFSNIPGVGKWNGTGWTMLPSSSGQLSINSITNIATDKAGNIYMCGSFVQNGFSYGMAKWDGASWTAFAGTDIYYFIVTPSGTVYAANADFTNSGYNVLQITGNTVTRIGGSGPNQLNANTWVQAMVLDPAGNLYAGGGFEDAAGNAYVAKWDGSSWTELGGTGASGFGATGAITGLAFDKSGNLYASGNLMQHSGTYLGRWNGQTWAAASDNTTGPFWAQNNIPFLNRDGRGNIYAGGQFNGSRNLGNYIYRYGDAGQSTPPVICNSGVPVTLSANETTVNSQSPPLVLSARAGSGAGTNRVFAFSTHPDFSTLLSPASPDSTLSIPISELVSGSNMIYVKMQTTDPCNNVLTAVDSITITKSIVSGILDIDYPNVLINAFPNPMDGFVSVSGLNVSKSYTLSLYGGPGMKIMSVIVRGQGQATINSLPIQPGVYWLDVYDNTRKRRIGEISLLKLH